MIALNAEQAERGAIAPQIAAEAIEEPEAAKAVRDLMSLMALPALWAGRNGLGVLQVMSEAIERIVPLRFTHTNDQCIRGAPDRVRLRIDGAAAEPAAFDAWKAVVSNWPARSTTKMETHLCVTPLGLMRVVHMSLGYGADAGKIRFGSDDPAFPTMSQVVVLRAAVSLAALGLQAARVNEERDEASRAKDEFLAMLGHELRNPLAPISAAAQLLRSGKLDTAQVSKASDVIIRQVAHMTTMVNDLLDVSRVTSGLVTLDIERLPLQRIVSDAIEQVAPLMEARQQCLTTDVPRELVEVMGDHKRLVQILTNLLGNAVKFTGCGGNIALQISVRQRQVTLLVSDNGIGMDAALIPKVFHLFAQAKRSSDRSQGGLGLGLALVKSLVELHAGTVSAGSAGLNQGSRFEVRLPCLAPVAVAVAQPASAALDCAGAALRILVVDDHLDGAMMLSMLLESLGHQTMVEHGAPGVLRRIDEMLPDVCILDIGLQGMDGNDLARRLRQHAGLSGAVLIAMTGYGQEADRQCSLAAGFDHHFVKPVDIAKLTQLLASIVRQREHPVPRLT